MGIFHLDIEFSGQVAFPLPLGQAAGRSRFQGRLNVSVAVKPLPHQWDKQGTFPDSPTVGLHFLYSGLQVAEFTHQAAVHRLQKLAKGQLLHTSLSFQPRNAREESMIC